MPYIPSSLRRGIVAGTNPPSNVGELTFLLYHCAKVFVFQNGTRFDVFAKVIGAFELTRLEIDWRAAHSPVPKPYSPFLHCMGSPPGDTVRALKMARGSAELASVMTQICWEYEFVQGGGSMADCVEALSALEVCKLQFHNNVVAPYEVTKMKENGDVLGF